MSDTSQAAAPTTPAKRPKTKIFVATPTHDHKFHASYVFSLYRTMQLLASQCTFRWSKVGGAGVARARNNQAHDFLVNTDCEFFFCIDGDIMFEPEHVAALLKHALHRGADNVAGLYALKDRELRWCVNPIPGVEMDPATGLQELFSAGTGFKCIARSAFERQRDAHPEIAYLDDLTEARGVLRWDFFSMGVVGPASFESRLKEVEKLCESGAVDGLALAAAIKEVIHRPQPPGRYLTEDWYFDRRHRALGGKVHADCTFNVKHEGLIHYPLQDPFAKEALWPAEFLAAGIAPDHCADVLEGCYDIDLTSLGDKFPAKPVVLDIGANIGAFAKWASVRWPGCDLHCYEPDPQNFALLLKTAIGLSEQPILRPGCWNVAVLDRAGLMPLRRGAHNCGEHSLFDVGEQTADAVEVEVIAASTLPLADIIKLDTEGAELPILTALANAGHLSTTSAVLLEYHSDSDRVVITTLLESHGFKLVAAHERCKDRGELKFLRAG